MTAMPTGPTRPSEIGRPAGTPSVWSSGGPFAVIGRLLRDRRGFAAVEFGLIAPILALFLIGCIEATRAIAINQRFSMATSMIADLVSREEKLTADDVNAIYGIAAQVMSPFDAAPLSMAIIPVMSSSTDANNTVVYPSTTNRPSYHGAAQPPKCDSYGLTQGLLDKNESVIVVEGSYAFTPLFGTSLFGSAVWRSTAVAKPRKALCVVFDGSNCTTSCFQ